MQPSRLPQQRIDQINEMTRSQFPLAGKIKRAEKEIKEKFPELTTYVTYTAPFWKLRVGDFRSHEEAYDLKRKLVEAFPTYGKEIYIVKEEVNIPL